MNKVRTMMLTVAALAAAALGGSAIAGAASSSSSTNSTGSTSSTAPSTQSAPAFSGPAHGTAAHEDAETPVTGANATKAQEAAVKAVGGGKAGGVTTDFTKDGYEVTVTKSDGTTSEVHMDSSFNVVGGPGGGPGGPEAPSA
jgi:hypothetical protein